MEAELIWIALALAGPGKDLKLGMEAQRAGHVGQAISAYERCLDAKPNHVECLWELGWSYWSQGEWEKVVATWTRVETLDPEHQDLAKYLGQAREHVGELEKLRAAAAAAPEVRAPVTEGQTLRIRAVGDLMIGTDFPSGHLPPEDGVHMFDDVASYLQDADITFGNLEGPLCDGGETKKCKGDASNCYAFRTPTSYGTLYKDAGFDLLSTANNHSGDFGDTCRRETEAALDKLGIAWSGPPGTIASVEHGPFKVAMIGFHTSPVCNHVNNHEAAAELVQLADLSHDLVIVSFHGGAEGKDALHVPNEMELFYSEKRGHLREFARVVVAAGADLVLGHGPHVPRGMEIVDGRLVAYSLGNFATWDRFNLRGYLGTSYVLEATLNADGSFASGKILPMQLVERGRPTPDPEKTAIDLIRDLSETDFPDTAPTIGKDGTIVLSAE